MKKSLRIVLMFSIAILPMLLQAQSPQAFNYQALARDAFGNPIPNQAVSFRVSILSGSVTGSLVYSETHNVTTNSLGLVNLRIGQGIVLSGIFQGIDWGNNNYYLKTEFDPAGGVAFVNAGTTQLLSVPYALYAANSGSGVDSINDLADARTTAHGIFLGTNSGYNTQAFKVNTAVGQQSLVSNTSGDYNTAVGYMSLYENEGNKNTAVGTKSLSSIVSGFVNTAVGSECMQNGTSGSYNVGVGASALMANTGNQNTTAGYSGLFANTSGSNNVALGSWSMYNNIIGYSNVAAGVKSLYTNQQGSYLVAIGDSALFNNSGVAATHTGWYNVGIGSKALYSNINGSYNLAVGHNALYNITTGYNTAIGANAQKSGINGTYNTSVGYSSNSANIGGSHNTAIGNGALKASTTSYNTALGSDALENNINGTENTAVGFQCLGISATGSSNTALGYKALVDNSVDNNTAIGCEAMVSNLFGTMNVAIGSNALRTQGTFPVFSTYEARNVAVGYSALYSNNPTSSSNGVRNTAVGTYAMNDNTIGLGNTAMGASALYANINGDNNTGIGLAALNDNAEGDYNTALGYNAGPTSSYPGLDNVSCIGNGSAVTASNSIRVGNSSIISITGNVNFTAPSDGRFKKEIREDIPGLEFILKLRPVSYYYDAHAYNTFIGKKDDGEWKGKYDIEKIKFSGFIAQEVELAAAAIHYDFSGVDKANDVMGLRYAEFVVPLVKAIQEQQVVIQKQAGELKQLRERVEFLEKK